MSHANAALTPRTRLRMARMVVEEGWTQAAVAKMFMVSSATTKKWVKRYREEGADGMVDRSSRPHHSPRRTAAQQVRRIVTLRRRRRLGPVQIGGQLHMPARRCTRC